LSALRRDLRDLLLGPDAKLIVLLRETADGGECTLERISVSQQHAVDWNAVRGRRAIENVLCREAREFAACVPGMSVSRDMQLQLNAAGDFAEGGPHGDNGLSGKKLVCDFYGPRVPIGGGAMSGKDLWKADRAGPLIARELAVQGVQRLGLRECTVTLVICPGDRAFRVASVTGPGGVALPGLPFNPVQRIQVLAPPGLPFFSLSDACQCHIGHCHGGNARAGQPDCRLLKGLQGQHDAGGQPTTYDPTGPAAAGRTPGGLKARAE